MVKLNLLVSCVLAVLGTQGSLVVSANDGGTDSAVWAYKCELSRCVKVEADHEHEEKNLSLPVCRLLCGPQVGTLWPYPTGLVKVGNTLVRFDPQRITFDTSSFRTPTQFDAERDILLQRVENKKSYGTDFKHGVGSAVRIEFDVRSVDTPFSLDIDEGYSLKMITKGQDVDVLITAQNEFGMRHALTTLSQLIVFDDIRKEMLIPGDVLIDDKPAYKHRGLVLDTSRSYFSVESIKRTIHAMSLSKMNVFHWHVTDSHSFPLVIEAQPNLSKYGAYRPEKIYTPSDVKEIVEFGRVRGVAVIPEFDAPAHVGEGWQKTDLTACFNAQPWSKYCVEPPCGQLDPTQGHLYDVLENIYHSMWTNFNEPHLFHMGGDEVSVACWNSSARIQDWMKAQGWNLEERDFMKLWGHFQDNALKRLDNVMGGAKRQIILWTSRLTDEPYLHEFVNKERTIIQIWTTGSDARVKDLLRLGFKVIVSNYDALYLDCGFGGWVKDGNNWCSPYIGWHKIYNNRMETIAGQSEYYKQILGAEAALWSEQVDELSMDSRLWPRTSALAERLWTNPMTDWHSAESRMLTHREELAQNGIAAETLEPEWCLQNDGNCPI